MVQAPEQKRLTDVSPGAMRKWQVPGANTEVEALHGEKEEDEEVYQEIKVSSIRMTGSEEIF